MMPPDLLFKKAQSEMVKILGQSIALASQFEERKVPYLFGGKTSSGVDSSGLIECCYASYLPAGVLSQYEHIKKWLFLDDDVRFIDAGDLLFFTRRDEVGVTNVAIVESIKECKTTIIYAANIHKVVTKQQYPMEEDAFSNLYVLSAVGKMQPFLLRKLLDDAINNEVKNARSNNT